MANYLYNNCVVAKLGTASTGNFLSGKLKHQTSKIYKWRGGGGRGGGLTLERHG
jgi:hypothetical protein